MRCEVERSGSWARDEEMQRLEQGMREGMQLWLFPLVRLIKKRKKGKERKWGQRNGQA